ncbi:MAG: helix-turn-helix transcriptional regulator [bacterium]
MTTFVFGPELGSRLRELRERAGLSQRELAHVMGRKPGSQGRITRLESGKLKHPTFGLVADYLRACGASFRELEPVLDRYTNRPPVRETRAREAALAGLAGDRSRDARRLDAYDRKTEAARQAAGQKPVPVPKRAGALARQLAAVRAYRAVDRAVTEEVNRAGTGLTYVAQKLALSYGRMVWRAMERTEGERKLSSEGEAGAGRRKRGRRRKTRAERLKEVEARMREQAGGMLPVAVLRRVAGRVRRLYEEMRG